jgi:hypothetical protein
MDYNNYYKLHKFIYGCSPLTPFLRVKNSELDRLDLFSIFSKITNKKCFKLLLNSIDRPNEFYINLTKILIRSNNLEFLAILIKSKSFILDYIYYDKFLELSTKNQLIFSKLLKWNQKFKNYFYLLKNLAINGDLLLIELIFKTYPNTKEFLNYNESIYISGIFGNSCISGNLNLVIYLLPFTSVLNILVGFNKAVLHSKYNIMEYLSSKYKLSLIEAFTICIEKTDIKTIEKLLEISSCDFYLYLCFSLAIRYKYIDLIKYLLTNYNSIDYKLVDRTIFFINDIQIVDSPEIISLLSLYDNTCSICLEDNSNYKTVCGHFYHRYCLNKWLLNNNYCPYCRNVF